MADETTRDAGDPASACPTDPKRATRSLGRGLEDVSHLFLTRRPGEAPVAPRQDTPATTGRTGPGLIRPWSGTPSRDQLRAVLSGYADACGEPLTVLHTGLPCDRAGEIDLLAVDAVGRLVIVDIEPADGDTLLLRGLTHLAWLKRNTALLHANHEGLRINLTATPRLVVLARQFPSYFQDAVQAAGGRDVRCVRYHALDLTGRLAFYFEPLGDAMLGGQSIPDIVFA